LCAEIDCFDYCKSVHINCNCENIKKISENKLEFLKNQRMRGKVEQLVMKKHTLKEVKLRSGNEKEKKVKEN